MKPKSSFELYRWIFLVLFWLIVMGLIVAINDFAVIQILKWLFYDVSYRLPTWNSVGQSALHVVFMSLFAGTITWFNEKNQLAGKFATAIGSPKKKLKGRFLGSPFLRQAKGCEADQAARPHRQARPSTVQSSATPMNATCFGWCGFFQCRAAAHWV